jgi:hypothetical protein
MDDLLAPLTRLLSDVILPNLKAVQVSQAEQIAANDRLENSIEELRVDLATRFALLAAQLTACRAEVAATQAMLRAFRQKEGMDELVQGTLIH